MPMGDDYRVRRLDDGIVELLLNTRAPDVGEKAAPRIAWRTSIEAQLQQTGAAGIRIVDAELGTQISDFTVEGRSVVQPDVVDPEANIVQQRWTECVAPINHLAIDGCIGKTGPQKIKRIHSRIVLLGMRVAAVNVVTLGRDKVYLDIVLVGVDDSRLCVAGVVLSPRSNRTRV